jgi:HlyD family secretion protein
MHWPVWLKSISFRRLIVTGVAVAIGAGVLFGAWSAYFRPIEVQVATVQRDVPVEVFGLGTVEARVTSRIGFKVSGVLVELHADVGDRVAKGAVLARLDEREQTARAARAKATVEQAAANLQKAMASAEKAKANFTNAKKISERRQKLVQTNITSVESAETAQAVEDAAAADVNVTASDVQVAKAAIGDAQAQLQQESATLDFHALAAPYDAMVTARSKELGSALGAGEPVFTLIDPKTVWVIAYIDESKAGEIKVGEPVEVVLRSRPGQRIRGKVARIEPESDRVNEERRVAIAYDRIPDTFNIGEQAEVYITTVHLPQAVLVPEAAITGLGKNRGSVWTLEDRRIQRHDVTLGHRLLDGRYEVVDGLPDKAQVIVRLRNGLRAGRAASIANEPGQ